MTTESTPRPHSSALRLAIVLLALPNMALAWYLHLVKLGATKQLACGLGGECNLVQFSVYGWFMGYDVALIGAVGYLLIAVAALVGLSWARGARWPSAVLLALATFGVLFTLRLKYGEFIVLRAFCPWCAVSAVSMPTIFALALLDWQRRGEVVGEGDSEAGGSGDGESEA